MTNNDYHISLVISCYYLRQLCKMQKLLQINEKACALYSSWCVISRRLTQISPCVIDLCDNKLVLSGALNVVICKSSINMTYLNCQKVDIESTIFNSCMKTFTLFSHAHHPISIRLWLSVIGQFTWFSTITLSNAKQNLTCLCFQ